MMASDLLIKYTNNTKQEVDTNAHLHFHYKAPYTFSCTFKNCLQESVWGSYFKGMHFNNWVKIKIYSILFTAYHIHFDITYKCIRFPFLLLLCICTVIICLALPFYIQYTEKFNRTIVLWNANPLSEIISHLNLTNTVALYYSWLILDPISHLNVI